MQRREESDIQAEPRRMAPPTEVEGVHDSVPRSHSVVGNVFAFVDSYAVRGEDARATMSQTTLAIAFAY